MDNILKPVLIAVIIILAVLIIWKANRFTTADQPEKETKAPRNPRSRLRKDRLLLRWNFSSCIRADACR